MTLTIQEISDRLEIIETITRYSQGLDQRVWSEWDLAFTPGAVVDFSFWGIQPCSPAELRTLFTANDATRIAGQHLLHNQLIWLNGDTARSEVEFDFTTLVRSDTPGFAIRNRGGGRYEDDLTRTHAGWRITHRRGTGKWNHQDRVRFQDRPHSQLQSPR